MSAAEIGNKAANLGIMQVETADNPNLKVPIHHGVKHQTIYDFLHKHTQGALQTLWNGFCKTFRESHVVDKNILKQIKTLILTTFKEQGTLIPDIREFLAKVPVYSKIIIRSSSREDTLTLANAGGNKTCINIPSNEQDIAIAMGEVVASYFSPRSIGQRQQAGDDITRDPFMPVLLQVMVGETLEGNVSASGVLFADESTGKTPGVSCIESAWGHNELVVGGLGPVDRNFVSPSGRVHALIAYKKDRLFPLQDAKGLEWRANPAELRLSPSLKPRTLRLLHAFYQKLKPRYGGSVDGEFTQVDHTKSLVHLLQVRPLPQKDEIHPTYLNMKPLAKAVSLVPADCRVRLLQDSDEVHYGKTVAIARRTFLELPLTARQKIKVVVVSTTGGSNSHEATEFRGNNIPVVYLSKVDKKLIKESPLLLVDVVNGTIGKIDRYMNEEALIANGSIKEGWAKHPLPALQSIIGDSLTHAELKAFVKEVAGDRTTFYSLACAYDDILEKIASDDEKERISAVAMVFKVAYSLTVKYKNTSFEQRALHLSRQLLVEAKEVWDAYKRDALPIEKLYAVNWLRATLTQAPQAGLVDLDSPHTLLADHLELMRAKELCPGEEWRAEILAVMLRVGAYGLNSSVQNDWRDFCADLCTHGNKELIDMLAAVQHKVAIASGMSYWLHGLFIPIWRQKKELYPCLKQLIIETGKSLDALKAASQLQSLVEQLEKGKLSGLAILDTIPELYLKQNSFGRLVLASAIGEVVESFDAMVKDMLGKSQEARPKIKKLQEMLRPYLGLMHKWLALVDSKDVPGHDDVQQVNRRIAEIAEELFKPEVLDSPLLEEQANISSRFNVSASQIGSGANFSRHEPKTLGDLFTLAHQNILFALGYLQKKEDVFREHLPPEVLLVAKALANTQMVNLREEDGVQHFVSYPPVLLAVNVDFPQITMRYNAPQRNHSALFDITAILTPTGEVQELTVGGKLFGYQAHDMPRMPWAAAYAELAALAGGFSFTEDGVPNYDRAHDMVAFTWKVDRPKEFAKHLPDYLQLITTSLYTGSRSRKIPIPGGQKNFTFTSEWALPKLDHTDNKTTFEEYYKKVSLDASDALRLEEAIANIKRIHTEWDATGLVANQLKSIAKWHKRIGNLDLLRNLGLANF